MPTAPPATVPVEPVPVEPVPVEPVPVEVPLVPAAAPVLPLGDPLTEVDRAAAALKASKLFSAVGFTAKTMPFWQCLSKTAVSYIVGMRE